MTFSPRRRKEDKYPGRILGFFRRFFIVIGVAATLSFVMLAVTLSRIVNYAPPSLPEKILLTYTFDRDLSEVAGRPSLSQPLLRPAATLHEVTAALRAAAKDDRVQGIVVRIEDVGFSIAQIQELRDAVKAFRKGGKFAQVFSEGYGGFSSGMGDYYLAAGFDTIWMQPVGSVAITGVAFQVPFLKGLLDKTGVAAEFGQRGVYKSAAESLTETGMTGPHREMMTSILNDVGAQIVADIAKDRGMDAAGLKKLVDEAPYGDADSLNLKLIDRLGYYDQMLDEARQKVRSAGRAGQAADKEVEPVDLLGYAFVSETRSLDKGVSGFLSKFFRKDAPPSSLKDKAKLALIFGAGDIVPYSGEKSTFSEGGMAANKIAEAFRAAQKDPDVAAIIFRIDSPGGAPSAAETIRRALLEAKEKGKPVVVSMGTAAASGGYWVAAAADRIVAQPATLTGSIGVFGGKFVLAGLLDKLGVGVETLAFGDNAKMWSPTTGFSERERKKFDEMLGHIYDAFIARVMEGRKMTREKAESVAQGRVFTGRQAKERGLVDALGGLDLAIAEAKKLAGLEGEVPLVRFPPRKSTLELFLSLATEGVGIAPGIDIRHAVMQAFFQEAAVLQEQVLKMPEALLEPRPAAR